MQIAITGGGGLVGRALTGSLRSSGVDVIRMVRRTPSSGEMRWSPLGDFDAAPLEGIDAVIHLAGESIVGRWSREKRERIRTSRVDATRNLCAHLVRLPSPPQVLIAASAIGIYGDRGEEVLDESSDPGQGFLAEVVRDWEAATEIAASAGLRVCNCRFGMILSTDGGALSSMLTPFRMGLGGRIGDGRQYWSWIAIDDCIAGLEHCLRCAELRGPVNFVSPHPVRNIEFTRELSRALHRPALLPVPKLLLRSILGQMADELLLASARVIPRRLIETGFSLRYPELSDALQHILMPSHAQQTT